MGRRYFHWFTSFFIPVAVSIFILFFHTYEGLSAQMTLAWDPNTEPDLAGYKVYYGTAARLYESSIDVGNVTTHTLASLAQGQTYFISVTAYDTSHRESEHSDEVSGVAKEPSQTYEVTTHPPGLQIAVDGVAYTAPQAFSWAVGSTHTVSVSSIQAERFKGGYSDSYVYSSWSDGGEQSHTIIAPSSPTTYTAYFNIQYGLTKLLLNNSGEGLGVPAVNQLVKPNTEANTNTFSIGGWWIFKLSGTDKGGAAVWFGNNALHGYGISLENGMFGIEGAYDIDSKGSINGTSTFYGFQSLAELGGGSFTAKTSGEVTELKFEMKTVNEEPLSINMEGRRLNEEPLIPADSMAKIRGSRKGTLNPLRIEPYQLDGEIYPYVFKASGLGLINKMGSIEMRGYFFFVPKNRVYGIYKFGGAACDTGFFSGRLDPASGIFDLILINEEGSNGDPILSAR